MVFTITPAFTDGNVLPGGSLTVAFNTDIGSEINGNVNNSSNGKNPWVRSSLENIQKIGSTVGTTIVGTTLTNVGSITVTGLSATDFIKVRATVAALGNGSGDIRFIIRASSGVTNFDTKGFISVNTTDPQVIEYNYNTFLQKANTEIVRSLITGSNTDTISRGAQFGANWHNGSTTYAILASGTLSTAIVLHEMSAWVYRGP